MELSRRNFLKTSAGAAGMLLLGPQAVALEEGINPREDMAMLVDVSKCVNCWWCYAVCKNYNDLPETLKPDPAEPPSLTPDVWTTLKPVWKSNEWHSRKLACNHCTEAACVEVCPTGALSYNKLGFVQYDKEKCSGCGYCAEFCPFGIPQLQSDKLTGTAMMDKCTFCMDRVTNGQQTACAEACPTGAIKFGRQSDLLKEGKDRAASLRAIIPGATFYGENELGGLHVMYVLDDRPEVYGLPSSPESPPPATIRKVFQWIGSGLAIAAVAGFGLNYLVARIRMTREGK
jgi:formate dehydrogenase iron-sulfur subunit